MHLTGKHPINTVRIRNQAVSSPAHDTAPPCLTYRGGPVLAAADVFTIFWGAEWQVGDGASLAADLNEFFKCIIRSPLIDELTEFSVPGATISRGTFEGSVAIPADPPDTITVEIAREFLTDLIEGTHVSAPTPNRVYFIYLPRGIKAVLGDRSSHEHFSGYHDHLCGGAPFALMPHPGPDTDLPVFDLITTASSHMLCETITDPVPGTGWYDDVNGEIGDICAWQIKTVGAYTVQQVWSNAHSRCY